MELTAEELVEAQKLRPAGKRFEKLKLKSGWIWISNPTRAQHHRFTTAISGDQGKAPDALEQIIKDCLVKPAVDEFDGWLDEWPGQLGGDDEVGPALGRLSGATGK